jgi:uncharacterized protein DUF1942
MKRIHIAVTAAAVAGLTIATAATASAYSTVGKFGSYERLYDAGGAVVTAWSVDHLEPSADRIPDYPLHGRLWEATATVTAVRGAVTPMIPNLNARTDHGRNYQALWEGFTGAGISGATLAQGGRSTGKIYFDVTGDAPTRVTYNNGVEDLLIWEK